MQHQSSLAHPSISTHDPANSTLSNSSILQHESLQDEASFSSPSTSEQATVEDTILEQAEFWNDATDEDNLDEVREISDSSPTDLDEAMICDIQCVVSRLAEKAPQLIGKLPYIYKQHVKLTYVHFRKFHNQPCRVLDAHPY